MMRNLIGLISAVVLVLSCGKVNFAGVGAKPSHSSEAVKAEEPGAEATTETPEETSAAAEAQTGTIEEAPGVEVVPPIAAIPGASAANLNLNVCSKLIADNPDQVIKASRSPATITLKEDAIVLLDVAGAATIVLNAADVKTIKGLCINASGQGNLSINTSLIVGGVYFVGRGNASLAVDFGATGTLANMAADVGGGSSMTVKGDKIDCTKLTSDVGGSGTVLCNGVSL
jgi:hypothetical protein